MDLRPFQLDPPIDEDRLEVASEFFGLVHLGWRQSPLLATSGQGTGRLADVPLHRMEPVTAIADVGSAQVLAGS